MNWIPTGGLGPEDLADWFAIGLSNLIVTYDPELIVIQGKYREAGDHFLRLIRDKANNVVLKRISKNLAIEYSAFGEDVGMIGAALYMPDIVCKTIDPKVGPIRGSIAEDSAPKTLSYCP